MLQFSVHVQDHDKGFAQALDALSGKIGQLPAQRLLFHVYSTVYSQQTLSGLIAALNARFGGCQIVCGTVAGGVIEHDYQQGIVISAAVFEREDSRAEVHFYDLEQKTDEAVACEIADFVRGHPWVKAIEIYRTVHDMNTTTLCETLSGLPQESPFFGGLVCSEQIPGFLSYLADQSGRLTDRGLVAIYYGGDDLHIKTFRMSGWKAIDKSFTVTRAERNVIKEIDGAPAQDIYKRYLDISPDEYFVMNVLEFPMISQDQGHSVVRNVFEIDPDGGLMVAYDVNPGTKLKICYADAASVTESIHAVSREIMQFTPDVVSVVSCITRSIIWRMKEYMPELHGLRSVAPCHGYLSHGELIREDGVLNHHNTILVAAAFREGGVKDVSYPEEPQSANSTIPLAVRLSTFISRVTEELKDMYSEVEQAATTDALTKIGNRYLFDDVVRSVSADKAHAKTKLLMMFDLNGLKFVNDTFGHNEGDVLIRTAAEAISRAFSPYGQCFRIGGDEFAAIVDFESDAALQSVLKEFYDNLRAYNSTASYTLSMAVGYAPLVNAQGKQLSDSDWKMAADINMYLDKTKFHAIKPTFLNQNMSDFIMCIMALVDNKHSATAYHSIRVQRMAVTIARLMGLEDAVIDRVNLGAYLHDIGKIGISDTILTKTEDLSEDERLMLRQRPGIGRRILSTNGETRPVADIVYACDERWDGGGYPEGLSGGDIPLEARIIAVAEFIDAAMHGGSAPTVHTAEKCIASLREEAGHALDPDVVSFALSNFGDIIKGDMAL